jgi:hypothetical protein
MYGKTENIFNLDLKDAKYPALLVKPIRPDKSAPRLHRLRVYHPVFPYIVEHSYPVGSASLVERDI